LKTIAQKFSGELILLLVTLLWGATFVIVKESLSDISSMLFISLRFLIAGIILLPFLPKIIRNSNFNSVKAGIILGLLNFFGFATQTVGLKYTSATTSGFITGSLVVMIPIFQTMLEKRKPKLGVRIGIGFVLTGLIFLSSGGNSIFTFISDLGTGFNFGDFLTLICAVLFALYVVYLDIVANKYDFWILLSIQIYTTAILGLIFSFILAQFNFEEITFNATQYVIFALLYTGIFATLVTTALQTKYQRRVSPSKAGIIYSFEPIFSAIFAFIIINEQLSILGYFGCGLIFLGLLISELLEKKN